MLSLSMEMIWPMISIVSGAKRSLVPASGSRNENGLGTGYDPMLTVHEFSGSQGLLLLANLFWLRQRWTRFVLFMARNLVNTTISVLQIGTNDPPHIFCVLWHIRSLLASLFFGRSFFSSRNSSKSPSNK